MLNLFSHLFTQSELKNFHQNIFKLKKVRSFEKSAKSFFGITLKMYADIISNSELRLYSKLLISINQPINQTIN